MKRWMAYGTVVLALAAAPVLAQQGTTDGRGSRPGSSQGTSGAQGGTGGTSTQGGTRSSGASGDTRTQGSADATRGGTADRQFVMEAAQGGLAEVELGQLASEKAQSDQVKQFAQRMVTDHGKANDELKTLAQGKSLTLPTTPGAKHQATKDKLSKLSGAAFDRAYMQEMVSDHRKDVSEFRKESQSGKDAEVKAWATKTLPTLQEHLQMAEAASRSAVGTSGTRGTGTENGVGGTTPRTGGTPTGGGPTDGAGGTSPRPGSGTGSGTGGSGAGGAGDRPGPPTQPGGGASGIGSPR